MEFKVIKQSQDIVNFLAFTNRLKETHLDVIWSSAQVKKQNQIKKKFLPNFFFQAETLFKTCDGDINVLAQAS